MWGDTFLAVERAHVLRVLLWGAMSLLAGGALLAAVIARRPRPPLIEAFGAQLAAWGLVELVLAGFALRTLAERDFAGVAMLALTTRIEVTFDAVCVAVGITLVVAAWNFGRRLRALGVGVGIAVQGLALLILHLDFLAAIERSIRR